MVNISQPNDNQSHFQAESESASEAETETESVPVDKFYIDSFLAKKADKFLVKWYGYPFSANSYQSIKVLKDDLKEEFETMKKAYEYNMRKTYTYGMAFCSKTNYYYPCMKCTSANETKKYLYDYSTHNFSWEIDVNDDDFWSVDEIVSSFSGGLCVLDLKYRYVKMPKFKLYKIKDIKMQYEFDSTQPLNPHTITILNAKKKPLIETNLTNLIFSSEEFSENETDYRELIQEQEKKYKKMQKMIG